MAKWRRYLYIFPLDKENIKDDSDHMDPHKNISKLDCDLEEGDMIDISQKMPSDKINEESSFLDKRDEGNVIQISETKPQRFSVNKVDQILRQLEGKMLSYKMFARDTLASRSM